jgi:hypothetical protein
MIGCLRVPPLLLILAVPIICYAGQGDKVGIPLAINELMASNSSSIRDPQGQYDDWIEVYNYGPDAINTAGMYLTDNLSVPTKWQIPIHNSALTIIPAGGFLLIWADNDTTDAGLHANFKLDAGGEEIGLFDTDGVTLIDSIAFGKQATDISYGRYPDGNDSQHFFITPSPASPNIDAYSGVVSDTKFSRNSGFYDTPFYLTIATETDGAFIFYTLDGSEPDDLESSSRSPNGVVYTGPVLINTTTCLRARAVKPGWMSSNTDSRTYIFLDDVIRQPRKPAGFPSSWGGTSADYEMDPDIVDDARYSDNIKNALTSIPTMSVVMQQEDMFGTEGILSNPNADREKPASVELIYPDGTKEGFQVNCGIKIIGGASRSMSTKYSFRLLFKGIYGPSKLRFPLFGPDAANEFNTIVLRSSFNDGYGWSGARYYEQYTRDEYIRTLQQDMGHVSPNSILVHLYINGLYWGIYFPCERPDASFSASYYGGDEEDWDTFSHTGITLREGNDSALNQMAALCRQASNSYEAYQQLQGNNPDGSRNPDYPCLLDVTNYIDYLILNYCVNNEDWPWNNYWFARKRTTDSTGFKFYCWDSEISLYLPPRASIELNRTTDFRNVGQFHGNLIQNNEYRMFFADRVHHHLFNNGILTPEYMRSLYLNIAEKVEMPVICESARWGDMHHHPPLNQDNWYDMRDWLLENFFQQRHDIVLQQLKNAGLYPNIDAPVFNINGAYQQGGMISDEDLLSISCPSGTILYTLDGSDPRVSGTSQQQATVLVPEVADKKAIVPLSDISETWKGGGDFDDSTWLPCIGGPGGVGFERTSGYQDLFTLDLLDQMYARNATCYIRIPFAVDADYDSLTLNVRYDDGFVAYLNGVEVARRNFDGTPAWDSRASASHSDSAAVVFENIDISDFIDTLQQGDNLLAIHAMNSSTTSGDFLISVELLATGGESEEDKEGVMEYIDPITLPHSAVVKARVLDGDTWSALNEAVYAIGPVAENLRITEIMYNPPDANEEFIELQNIGSETINLNLVSFTNGVDFTFPSIELAAGQYTVVVQNRDIFEARYGRNINIAGQYSGRLDNAGERITLEDAIGRTILDFSYKDGWRSITDGEGFSLTIIDAANPDLNSWGEKDSWRPSAYEGGSPGYDDSGIVPNPGSVVINEVLAHSPTGAPDWIELYNTTSTAIDIGGWFISDGNDNLFKYEIAGGTTIGPNGYLVFYEDLNFGNANDPGCHEAFALSENGERLYLSSAHNGELTGYRSTEDFGPSQTDVSFGRYYKESNYNYNFVAMEEKTPGSANSYPKVGPIIISEIMYNPDWPDGGSYTNDQYEYIELQNISAEPVTLYNSETSEPWKFTDGVDFTFPSDTPATIPAGGYIFIVNNPAAFSWRYPAVPAEIIFGPYNGNLSNSDESLELSMPGDADNEGVRQYIRIDRVNYSDGSHPENCPGNIDLWPIEADGGGMSLTRNNSTDYGNDPENWTASIPSPGQ